MSTTRLIANLGGEEGRAVSPASGAAHARTEAAASLWRLLFAREVRGPEWPADLGPPPESAVFPWLEDPGEAMAWLVTEAAVQHAADEGRRLAGPDPQIVSRVHDKAFSVEAARREGLEPVCLAGLATVFDPADLADGAAARGRIAAVQAAWPEWLGGEGQGAPRAILKPRHGTSGRGRTAFTDAAGIEPATLARLAARGGAILEPWLDRERDFSVQLHLGESGVLLLGTLEQCVTAAGVPRGLRGTLDKRGRVTSGCPDDETLREAAVAVALRAQEAGYTGPCGVDAFRFRGPQGSELRPVVEFNARFTLGTVAVGLARRVRQRAARYFRLDAGKRLGFHLELGPDFEPDFQPDRAMGEETGPEPARLLSLELGGSDPRDRVRLRIAQDPERLGVGEGSGVDEGR